MDNEYPKAMYRGEDSAVAKSVEHELTLVDQGFASLEMLNAPKAEEKPKQRNRKAEPEAE